MFRAAVLFAPLALVLAGCSSSSQTVASDDAVVTVDTSSVGLGGSLGGISAGVGSAFISTPAPDEDQMQALFGPWTLARSGDRVCTVDLGSKNAAGEYTAKTRRCNSVELARIAVWQPGERTIELFDFDRRPVVRLEAAGQGVYEGVLADGNRLTLWR